MVSKVVKEKLREDELTEELKRSANIYNANCKKARWNVAAMKYLSEKGVREVYVKGIKGVICKNAEPYGRKIHIEIFDRNIPEDIWRKPVSCNSTRSLIVAVELDYPDGPVGFAEWPNPKCSEMDAVRDSRLYEFALDNAEKVIREYAIENGIKNDEIFKKSYNVVKNRYL
jgi:hypothetical protein